MSTETPLLLTSIVFALDVKQAALRLFSTVKEIVESEQTFESLGFAADALLTMALKGPGELIRQGAIWGMIDERSMHLLETLADHGAGYEVVIMNDDTVVEIIDSREIIL